MELVAKGLIIVAVVGIVVGAIAGVWSGLSAIGSGAMQALQVSQRADILIFGQGHSALKFVIVSIFGYPEPSNPVNAWVALCVFMGGAGVFYLAFLVVRLVRAVIG